MTIFKDHNITVKQLLGFIPEALIANLSLTSKIDHYAKVLHGNKLFYLQLYGILDNDRLSQRSLEDTFNASVFKVLFNLDEDEKVCRSSISERLSKVDPDYFRQIYEYIYERFSCSYTLRERKQYNLIRVDSTIVSETAGKLTAGIVNAGSSKKAIKYSLAFDGLLPGLAQVFTSPKYGNEDNALPEVVMAHVKKEPGHQNIYVLDRGLQSTRTMKTFSESELNFICRSKENRKFELVESLITEGQNMDMGGSILLRDSIVRLYTGMPIANKRGNKHYREVLVDRPFRLVVVKSKSDDGKEYWLLTNEFDLSAKDIAQAYRRRWDMEVFFRFLKQELNVSHLVSLNKNGLQVMLYMTLITSMLVLIYKKGNKQGYKTSKRRFAMEVRDLAIALIVVQCGGDPGLFFKT
ncbi:IS4 family transposase [Mucilaginibacter sabulilitoris]|uniref:IS4 family transposase n=1 Tax=Mucilaginibacter sabulilitoris TaxID=1173583 RepID=A0ABZ0TLD7_9SPHI|nr:IS4 family transposase [Mucilaginibacter sabulilitoris]WPU93989.1 IS4 family transposase [Mucilaginibacter sabulilitoris]